MNGGGETDKGRTKMAEFVALLAKNVALLGKKRIFAYT